ncbi:MAG TPA: glycosyltransferase [Chloroflexota bacterium]|nr:glycosyltransferase [Chloroflexota bacterium]
MRLVFFGLSISSSWGNGHATCYRGLLKALHDRGHSAVFYERRTEWYDSNCDLPAAPYCDIRRYQTWPPPDAAAAAAAADVVVLGSLAGDGRAIAGWLPGRTAALLVYYDIDTPKTLTAFAREGAAAYLSPRQLPAFDLVLSFAGGPVLDELRRWGARRPEAFYCAVDPALHRPAEPVAAYRCDLGFLGTLDPDRRAAMAELFTAPARARPQRRFVFAGPDGGASDWPPNVGRFGHVNPGEHAAYYSSCDWQLNLTREEMQRWGWSPSVRLFEAAACGAPLISDRWEGIEDVLRPDAEVLLAGRREDVLSALDLAPEARRALARAARARVLAGHTYAHRAARLEALVAALGVPAARPPAPVIGGPGDRVTG